jgi:hypothetical protein
MILFHLSWQQIKIAKADIICYLILTMILWLKKIKCAFCVDRIMARKKSLQPPLKQPKANQGCLSSIRGINLFGDIS